MSERPLWGFDADGVSLLLVEEKHDSITTLRKKHWQTDVKKKNTRHEQRSRVFTESVAIKWINNATWCPEENMYVWHLQVYSQARQRIKM